MREVLPQWTARHALFGAIATRTHRWVRFGTIGAHVTVLSLCSLVRSTTTTDQLAPDADLDKCSLCIAIVDTLDLDNRSNP